jgi:hypothetical protein
MENQKPSVTSDEIDLGQVITKIGDFFISIGIGLLRILAIVRSTPIRNKPLFIGLVVLGGGLGYSYSTFLKRKFYESSMILSSEYTNLRIMDNSIEKLNLLAGEASHKGLASELHISDTLASVILKFEVKPFIAENELIEIELLKEQLKNLQINSKNQAVVDQVIRRIEVENRHAFEFTVRTYSPTVIKPLQGALVNYLRNNDYIKKRMEIARTNLGLRKLKLVGESKKLDSLKKVIYANYESMADKQSRQGSNNVILSDKSMTNPLDVYNQDLSINDQILSINRTLFIEPDFELIDGFTAFNEPASASKSKIIVAGMLIGFLFAYFIVAVGKFDKYLAAFE